jgi:hypothetical protein
MQMSIGKAIVSGLIGACTLTLIHETARRVLPEAPRMDVLGMRAIARSLLQFNQKPPAGKQLHTTALVGDILTNTLYYSLVGVGKPEHALTRGLAIGLAAGLGGVVLPGPLGLGKAPSARTPRTAIMAVGWYLAGGLATALAYQALTAQDER